MKSNQSSLKPQLDNYCQMFSFKNDVEGKRRLICRTCLHFITLLNKRAQRALGRSPEENVKAQGEAIYRGPLMLFTKYW